MATPTENPMVSIICTTYNHESYIRQALEGFIMQQCNFPFEIVVHDDASTDGTADIIREYIDKYPSLFNAVLQSENQYSQGNDVIDLLYNQKARGKYIAICEGDDYWTDPLKLQKQADFLENHLNIAFVCHRYKTFYNVENRFDERVFPYPFDKWKNSPDGIIIDKKIFHKGWFVQPLTSMIRRNALLEVSKQGINFLYFRDIHMFYFLLEHGNGVCLDIVGGVYNMNEGGIHSGLSKVERIRNAISIHEELYLYTKDIMFLKRYIYYICCLVAMGKNYKLIYHSLFHNLSFSDKLNIVKCLFR